MTVHAVAVHFVVHILLQAVFGNLHPAVSGPVKPEDKIILVFVQSFLEIRISPFLPRLFRKAVDIGIEQLILINDGITKVFVLRHVRHIAVAALLICVIISIIVPAVITVIIPIDNIAFLTCIAISHVGHHFFIVGLLLIQISLIVVPVAAKRLRLFHKILLCNGLLLQDVFLCR